MNATPSPRTGPEDALRTFFGVPFRAQTYRNLAYLALAFPLGLAYFVGVSVGVSTGLGLAITLVGIPLLVVTVAAVTAAAGLEARLAQWLVGIDAELPEFLRSPPTGEGLVDATKRLLTAPTTWTSLVLVLVKFVYGVVTFAALVTAVSVSAALLSTPVFYDTAWATYNLGPYVVDTLPEALATGLLGVLFTLVSLHVLNALATVQGMTTATLLGGVRTDPPEEA